MLGTHRTDPDKPDSSIRPLPRVFDGEAPIRPGMKDARRGKPAGHRLRHPVPRKAVFLAALLIGVADRHDNSLILLTLEGSCFGADLQQIFRIKSDSLHRTPAGFTTLAIDGSGLRGCLPARPTSAASCPISVRRVATLLHASSRRSLAVPPLRFASASPPSSYTGDLHPKLSDMSDTQAGAVAPPLRGFGLDGLTPHRFGLPVQAKVDWERGRASNPEQKVTRRREISPD